MLCDLLKVARPSDSGLRTGRFRLRFRFIRLIQTDAPSLLLLYLYRSFLRLDRVGAPRDVNQRHSALVEHLVVHLLPTPLRLPLDLFVVQLVDEGHDLLLDLEAALALLVERALDAMLQDTDGWIFEFHHFREP